MNNADFYIISELNCQASEIFDKTKLIISVRHSDRMWLTPLYYDKSIKSKSNVKVVIPKGPNDPNIIIDSLIAFSPIFFNSCIDYEKIIDFLSKKTRLDFDKKNEDIIEIWTPFRESALLYLSKISIWKSTKVLQNGI